MYYYHMLWFISLSVVLSFVVLKYLYIHRNDPKLKPYFYSLFGIILVYILTLFYILKTKFKTSYIIVPYERIFIILLLLMTIAQCVFIYRLIDLYNKKLEIDETSLNAIISILGSFLFISFIILILPIKSDIHRDTYYDNFYKIIMSGEKIHKTKKI